MSTFVPNIAYCAFAGRQLKYSAGRETDVLLLDYPTGGEERDYRPRRGGYL